MMTSDPRFRAGPDVAAGKGEPKEDKEENAQEKQNLSPGEGQILLARNVKFPNRVVKQFKNSQVEL